MPGLPVLQNRLTPDSSGEKPGKNRGKKTGNPALGREKSLVTWLKNRLQTVYQAFLRERVTENTGRKSSPVYPETGSAVLCARCEARPSPVSGRTAALPAKGREPKQARFRNEWHNAGTRDEKTGFPP
ncbi:hypothetical protein OFAG_02188 [Oxalobacter formigenes HOxBLS]|uniref:Uncharacterized protein n=1 Tax=Oxalobacter paraformigenes TaxID=556268 RepID=T5LPX2_9BURK|nr:hypothetical protein OFAG_02188 [Oxalobacter paraformigenes]